MNLHGDFTNSNFRGDLLVHQSCSYQGHHLPLASAKRAESSTQIRYTLEPFTPLPIAVERNSNSVQKVLLVNGLCKELNRASFHSSDRHRDVTVAGDKNDWNVDLHFGLQFEPAQSRQSDIQNEATRLIRYLALKEFLCRPEGLTFQVNRFKEGS